MKLDVLSKKLAILISIISGGQRVQTIHSLKIKVIKFVKDKVILPITSKIKQTKPSRHMAPVCLKAFPEEPKFCAVKHLKIYMEKNSDLARNFL